jgi:hypothetical protein
MDIIITNTKSDHDYLMSFLDEESQDTRIYRIREKMNQQGNDQRLQEIALRNELINKPLSKET